MRDNHIAVGCREEGCHGPLGPNPNPSVKRRVRTRAIGTVIRAAEQHKWVVVFNFDGGEKIVVSSSLKVVDQGTGAPFNELSVVSPVE